MYNVTNKTLLKALLHEYELEPFKHQLAGTLSGGYQRRLALVCALAHDPQVLFLDEPTAGIDPVTRKSLWDKFYSLSAQGKSIFVTTHYMEEAQRCHQLAFISSGHIVAQGSPSTIKNALGNALVYSVNIPYQPELRAALLAVDGMLLVNQFGNELRIVVKPEIKRSALEDIISKITGQASTLVQGEPNLEDVFIALTQEPLAHS